MVRSVGSSGSGFWETDSQVIWGWQLEIKWSSERVPSYLREHVDIRKKVLTDICLHRVFDEMLVHESCILTVCTSNGTIQTLTLNSSYDEKELAVLVKLVNYIMHISCDNMSSCKTY